MDEVNYQTAYHNLMASILAQHRLGELHVHIRTDLLAWWVDEQSTKGFLVDKNPTMIAGVPFTEVSDLKACLWSVWLRRDYSL